MIVSIHQPNFFPWIGYFNKIFRADIFVLLDDVQLPRKGAGSWVNRAKILVKGEEAWITVPIVRKHHSLQLIKDTAIFNATRWRRKIIKTIDFNYRRSQYYNEFRDSLIELINYPSNNISTYNYHNILSISKSLGVDERKFVLSSNLNVTGKATQLLVNITKAVGGDAYMCGGGADGYQQDDLFEKEGIQLIYQHFDHPEYQQVKAISFIPGLSIIDALMNSGINGTKKMLQQQSGISS
jgi:hypothetical protein